jgi:hypothetical protein
MFDFYLLLLNENLVPIGALVNQLDESVNF